MTITNDYSFGTEAEMLNAMTDEEVKEYFESIEADSYLASMEFHDSKFIQ